MRHLLVLMMLWSSTAFPGVLFISGAETNSMNSEATVNGRAAGALVPVGGSSYASISATAARSGNYGYKVTVPDNGARTVEWDMVIANEYYFSVMVRVDVPPPDTTELIHFESNSQHSCGLWLRHDGRITMGRFWYGQPGYTKLATTTNALTVGVWDTIQFHARFSSTNGIFEVGIGNRERISVPQNSPSTATMGYVAWGGSYHRTGGFTISLMI